MSAETMTDAQADALIEAVGERMEMHQGAWDMVNGRELARAFAAELRATPQDGPCVWIGRDGDGALFALDSGRDGQPIMHGEAHQLPDPFDVIDLDILAPGECQRFRLVPEGEGENDVR